MFSSLGQVCATGLATQRDALGFAALKQLRISTALNRRYYYFQTADERVGDLLREQLEAARTLRTVVPERKRPKRRIASGTADGEYARLGFGT